MPRQAPKHHLDPGQQQGIPMARRLPPPIMGLSTGIPMARRLRPQSGSHPKAGSLEPPVPAKGSDSSPNAYRKTSIGRGSTSIVHIASEPYNVLISAKNLVVCTQLYRIIQGFHNRMPQSRSKQRLEGYIIPPLISPRTDPPRIA